MHRRVARVIGVVHRRPVGHLRPFAHREIVGDRDRLAVGDAEPVEVPGERRPGAHAGGRTRLRQVNRRQAAGVMALAVARKVALMRSPPHLSRLRALAHEAVDRPGVHELAGLLGDVGELGIALGDVHHLDAQPPRQLAPFGARGGCGGLDPGIGGDVNQRLLHEVRHQPRVGAVGEHRGGRARVARAQRERLLAQNVIGAAAGRHRGIGVAPRPRLDAGVEVHRTFLPAQLDQRQARDLHGNVDQEIAAPEQRIEHAAEVLARQTLLDQPDAVGARLLAALVLRGDDGEALGRNTDVTQHQRQDALADAAETDEQDPARELDVNLVLVTHDAR